MIKSKWHISLFLLKLFVSGLVSYIYLTPAGDLNVFDMSAAAILGLLGAKSVELFFDA